MSSSSAPAMRVRGRVGVSASRRRDRADHLNLDLIGQMSCNPRLAELQRATGAGN
jgi:hypothetical protein